MANSVKSTNIYTVGDSLSFSLGDCSTKHNEYFSFDIVCMDEPSFETYMTRDKLRGLAVFILNYLENN